MITIFENTVQLSPSLESGLTQKEFDDITYLLGKDIPIKKVAEITDVSKERINNFLLSYIVSR